MLSFYTILLLILSIQVRLHSVSVSSGCTPPSTVHAITVKTVKEYSKKKAAEIQQFIFVAESHTEFIVTFISSKKSVSLSVSLDFTNPTQW